MKHCSREERFFVVQHSSSRMAGLGKPPKLSFYYCLLCIPGPFFLYILYSIPHPRRLLYLLTYLVFSVDVIPDCLVRRVLQLPSGSYLSLDTQYIVEPKGLRVCKESQRPHDLRRIRIRMAEVYTKGMGSLVCFFLNRRDLVSYLILHCKHRQEQRRALTALEACVVRQASPVIASSTLAQKYKLLYFTFNIPGLRSDFRCLHTEIPCRLLRQFLAFAVTFLSHSLLTGTWLIKVVSAKYI